MEKRSTHYGDVAKWIKKVIDSCAGVEFKSINGRKFLIKKVQNQNVAY